MPLLGASLCAVYTAFLEPRAIAHFIFPFINTPPYLTFYPFTCFVSA